QLPNRRLYGGKELQDETLAGNTLDWYDFEARMYDPLIGRFLTTDPLAEKYYGITPYGYCGNNPMKYIDPSGKDLEISIDKENKTILVRANFYYNSSQLEQGYDFNTIKMGFQNAMNTWSENIKTAFDNMQFEGFSVNVQFEWKEVDIKDATGVEAINIIKAAAEADPIGNSIVHVEETNPRSEVKGSKHLKANMWQAAADSYLYFETDGNTAMHELGHFFGLRDRYDPTNPEHASYIEGDLMTKNPPRENAVKPFMRIIDYNNLTPETSKTISINKNNREPK
ncbi:MAG: cell well associated RhsD protein, partial [bacterium P201]